MNRRHIFISHHHPDDEHVDACTERLKDLGFDVRNSSLRVSRPNNIERMKNGKISQEVLRRALRMKIAWAGTVVVLVGQNTHQRDWVDWEIRKAHEFGKRIVGVYLPGHETAPLPSALEDYASSIVTWDSNNFGEAVCGDGNPQENPDGSPRASAEGGRSVC